MFTIGFMLNHPHFIPHAQTLIHSIRTNGGFLSTASIFILHPQTFTPSYFSDANTTLLPFETPSQLQSIPFADKLSAAQTLEQHLDCTTHQSAFLWLDVDSLILQPPQALLIPYPQTLIAYKTVDKCNIGIFSTQKLDPFWRAITDHFDYQPPVLLHYTTVSHQKIHPYINAGLILTRDSKMVFTKAVQAMCALQTHPDIQAQLTTSPLHNIFFHQAVLTIAIIKTFPAQQRAHMADELNYPLHFHHELGQDLSQIQTLRYDTYFDNIPPQDIPQQIHNSLPVEPQALTSYWPYT